MAAWIFQNVEVIGHDAHYHKRLLLEAWMCVKNTNAENDHMVIPDVYECLAHTQKFSRVTCFQHARRLIFISFHFNIERIF